MVYDGEGEIIFKDGGIFKGTLVNGFMSGKGTYTYPDKTCLKINFNQNQFTG